MPTDQMRKLVNGSVITSSDDLDHLISRATLMQQSKPRFHDSLDGNDVLTFIWYILADELYSSVAESVPWAETDRLIALAKEIAHDACTPKSVSHSTRSGADPANKRHCEAKSIVLDRFSQNGYQENDIPVGHTHNATEGVEGTTRAVCVHPQCISSTRKPTSKCPRGTPSPYFTPKYDEEKLPRRQLAGIVSSVPFPPLSSPQFGLIQEQMADEPFWLLIAVTFLIKTNGQVAIPVFYKVKERFPSPNQLADPDNAEELLGMIRHLGLAKNRLKFIQKYAIGYLYTPPTHGKVYKVRNYDKRDMPVGLGRWEPTECRQKQRCDALVRRGVDDGQISMEAWEIGHMTQGRYTIDSWRIFCRDKLLGRAEDWNGKGREAEFQPEWMRVMPRDKELRAYLRWMWMREGWEWDPDTGERKVLGHELQRAVNEHRVEYDDKGGLRILDSPRQMGANGQVSGTYAPFVKSKQQP